MLIERREIRANAGLGEASAREQYPWRRELLNAQPRDSIQTAAARKAHGTEFRW